MEKGASQLLVSIITAGGLLLASIFTSWTTADKRVGQAEKNIAVVEERENLHYSELSKAIGKIDEKLEKISDKLGVVKR